MKFPSSLLTTTKKQMDRLFQSFKMDVGAGFREWSKICGLLMPTLLFAA
jgi:hypothetical protein